MVTATRGQFLPRTARLLIAGLLAISAALFVVGIAVERTGENPGVSAVQPNAASAKPVDSDGVEGQSGSGEGHVDTPTTSQTTPVQNESFLGIDLENPWLVGAAVLGSLVLMAALWRFGYRVLPIIVLFAVATALFDVSEVLRQLQRNNIPVLLLAGVVLTAHVAVAIVALQNFSKYRTGLSHAEPQVPSMTS